MRVKFVVLFRLLQSLFTDANVGPNNAAVLSGTSVQMQCRNPNSNVASCQPASDLSNIYWQFFAVGSSKLTVQYDTIPPKRLSFNQTCDGQFDIIINETRFEDAGTYTCVTPSGPQHTAQLIVLDSEPSCSLNSTKNDEDAIRCTVNFSGNWPPTLKWQTVSGVELSGNTRTTPTSVTSVLKRTTMKLVEGATARFNCETYFENQTDKKEQSTSFRVFADNIPTYRNVWTSPEMKLPSRDHFSKSTESTDEINKHAPTRLPDGHSTLIAIMISLILVVIAFLTTVTTIYFVKKYRKRKHNRTREAPRAMEYYAEISQRGNVSMDNGSLQLNSIAFQRYDETSLSTRGPPHYPQYRHFDEDDIAAYSETRTIASIPAIIKSGKSALSLNKHIPESASSFEVVSRPSVDSAMPVYAEVQKSKNLRKYENDSSSSKWSIATSEKSNGGVIEKGNEPKEEHENVGADGTEYVKVTDKSRDQKKIPLPKKTKEDAIYIGVDHTRRKPPPPPPFY